MRYLLGFMLSLSATSWAAAPTKPDLARVALTERERSDGETTAPLWESRNAFDACARAKWEASTRQIKNESLRLDGKEPLPSVDLSVCTESLVAVLIPGEEIGAIGECGQRMVRVRVGSGKHKGKEGCLSERNIAPSGK